MQQIRTNERLFECKLHLPTWRYVDYKDCLFDHYHKLVDLGYEGIICRDPSSRYKFGRTGKKGKELLRSKPFEERTGIVIEVIQGYHNHNEVEELPNGRTKRATKKENKTIGDFIGGFVVQDPKTEKTYQ